MGQLCIPTPLPTPPKALCDDLMEHKRKKKKKWWRGEGKGNLHMRSVERITFLFPPFSRTLLAVVCCRHRKSEPISVLPLTCYHQCTCLPLPCSLLLLLRQLAVILRPVSFA
ncbi:hypothetical protein TRVL_09608 [Trypanosoma vivax]|nr:hypothetical protein TRVL_09608 [Trypanosoma vivax]